MYTYLTLAQSQSKMQSFPTAIYYQGVTLSGDSEALSVINFQHNYKTDWTPVLLYIFSQIHLCSLDYVYRA